MMVIAITIWLELSVPIVTNGTSIMLQQNPEWFDILVAAYVIVQTGC